MRRKSIITFSQIFIVLFLEFLYSCGNDSVEPAKKIAKKTVLAYVVGENTLSEFVSGDVAEMKMGFAALTNPDENNLLVYIDDYKAPRLLKFEKKNNLVTIDTLKTYPEQNSLQVANMSAVLHEVFSSYEAEKYGLVLWSHANGWLPGSEQPSASVSPRSFGDDSGFHMDLMDLKTALQASPKFEFILFDACNLQGIEVVYELRDRADYFIGSPGEIPGYGAPYDLVVPAMFSSDNAPSKIAQQYFSFYEGEYNYTPAQGSGISSASLNSPSISNRAVSYPYGAAISVVRSENLSALASASKSIIQQYAQDKIATSDLLSYDDYYRNYYYDLGELIARLTSENDPYPAWKTLYDKVVVDFFTTNYILSMYKNSYSGVMIPMRQSTGLSTFIPIAKNENFLDGSFWKNQSQSDIESKIETLNAYYLRFQWYAAGGWASVN